MRIRLKRLALEGVTLAFAAVMAVGQAKPAHGPFTAKDWAGLHSAHAAAMSANGTILYGVAFGAEKGPTHTEWWTVGADGNNAKKLEMPDGFHPMGYTRDGQSLYGGWKVNDHQQFAVFAVKEGKIASAPTVIVALPRGVGSASPSPDGKRFAMTADPREPDPLENSRHVQEPEETSLYVVNANGTDGAWWCKDLKYISGAITVGGGASAAAWSADSQSLAVLSQVPRIGHHEVGSMIDVCSASGSRHVANIANSVNGIAWVNGGKDLAFLSTKSLVLTPEHVWTVPAAGGTAEDRTPDLNATAVQLASDANGRVWVSVNRGVRSEVDEFRDGILKTAYAWPDGIVRGTPVESEYAEGSAGEQLAFTVSDPTHMGNVAVAEGEHLRKITHEGDEQLKEIELGLVQVVQWKSKGGRALEGIATFPAGYEKGKKYPFLVLPHGGPEANDELAFDAFSRTVAGLGYVVLQPQYRGSTGYGADFLAAIYQHFGDRAYEDVDSATDFAIAQGWADPNRLAIFGWSAGGFMTSWTVTQTGRYKAAIEGAGITDWAPFLWTSDIAQVDYDARWTEEDPAAFSKFSAVYFANKVTTPLLILHGEADQRVPTFQGTEYFQLLAARGKTVRMVTYPGSPHFPVLWEQRLDVMQELAEWLAKYNK
ncbi:S9 family peptidase [Telmatobacter sp. DSM 110680]|uniref:S9 family peptidase n=1 Tax=Telmatobacter sp. DSM 110680 TaxID=3036704 RepID=A0AAU7DNI0_9BACT